MTAFIIRRILVAIPTLLLISIISFIVIELPPGDYVSGLLAGQAATGAITDEQMEALRERYGLNDPPHIRYLEWISGFFVGDFGYSLSYGRPVLEIVGPRLGLTILVSMASILFAWIVALPLGLISAVKQYTTTDYSLTLFGFLGLSIPNFMLALVLMYFAASVLGVSVGGLFSPEFAGASWSFARLADLLSHLWIPVIVIGTAGMAGTMRIVRNNTLDELRKPYVMTARAKGLREWHIILKYPLRYAINPLISTVGWILPQIIGGAVITSVVLSLPTAGPVFLRALRQQDMYLAGFFVMVMAALTVIGTLLSDILLAVVDPRIRYNR